MKVFKVIIKVNCLKNIEDIVEVVPFFIVVIKTSETINDTVVRVMDRDN